VVASTGGRYIQVVAKAGLTVYVPIAKHKLIIDMETELDPRILLFNFKTDILDGSGETKQSSQKIQISMKRDVY
jgi:hypothetical protein